MRKYKIIISSIILFTLAFSQTKKWEGSRWVLSNLKYQDSVYIGIVNNGCQQEFNLKVINFTTGQIDSSEFLIECWFSTTPGGSPGGIAGSHSVAVIGGTALITPSKTSLFFVKTDALGNGTVRISTNHNSGSQLVYFNAKIMGRGSKVYYKSFYINTTGSGCEPT